MATHHGIHASITFHPAEQSRVRHLVWPREHGAWGMLLVPLATGAGAGLMTGRNAGPLVLLVIAALTLFCLRTPLESLWGTSPMKARTYDECQAVTWYIVVFATTALASVACLFALAGSTGLLAVGTTAAAAFVLQAALRRAFPRCRMLAQVIGAAGLTSTAAAAYCVATGWLDWRALALWMANWVFAGNQIHFVQVRLHSARLSSFKEKLARGGMFFDGQFAMIAVLLFAWGVGLLPLLALAAFVPIMIRGLVWFFRGSQPLSVKRLGFTELAHAIAFGALLTVAFRAG